MNLIKRFIVFLMVFALVFSFACGKENNATDNNEGDVNTEDPAIPDTPNTPYEPVTPDDPDTPDEPVTPDEPDEPTVPEEPVVNPTLLNNAQSFGVLGNTYHVANTHIDSMKQQEINLYGNYLLVSNYEVTSKGHTFTVKMVSLVDGSLVAEASMPTSGFMTMQVNDTNIGITDPDMEKVRIFDNKLNLLNEYVVDKHDDDFSMYLSTDMHSIYHIGWEKGISVTNLDTMETRDVLTDITEVYVRNQSYEHVIISYVDLNTQRRTASRLNLSTGDIEKLPTTKDTLSAQTSNGAWLLSDGGTWGKFIISNGGENSYYDWQENRFELLAPSSHLMRMNQEGKIMDLYSLSGEFVSRCVLEERGAGYIGGNILWSDLYNGYFFMYFDGKSTGKLIFWNISAETEGQNLNLRKEAESTMGNTAPKECYERALAIGEKYGIKINIADLCQYENTYFDWYDVNNATFINEALDVIDNALACYPKGFIEQLKFDNINSIVFELVGGLRSVDQTVYEGGYSALASRREGAFYVVFDLYIIKERIIFHELTHLIDDKLAYDASLRDEALFSEEKWLTLQPEGFEYAETYGTLPQYIWKYVNSGYFINDYACRTPEEDRAEMMEQAMLVNKVEFENRSGLVEKFKYYCSCIRDAFNTEGWPEVTQWEQILK